MVTGDDHSTAKSIGRQVGILPHKVIWLSNADEVFLI